VFASAREKQFFYLAFW